ncbi:ABC transporter ATP-binding protein [Yoonia sp. SS1-5]|uniref:ABC transporter ATP-binding protein n=1 Tax=Yoonia rhodophyticola TaxID=3137370 RepID=A0AAN0M9S9_9RHOB
MSETPLIAVEGIDVSFASPAGEAFVLKKVSLEVNQGETLGIVGESGSGKSMTALTILQLIPTPPGNIAAGRVMFNGVDLLDPAAADIRDIRGNQIAMVFQEPMTSLNPVLRIGDQIVEGLRRHKDVSQTEARNKAIALLTQVGIPSPERRVDAYPHELSGGMRQRVMIAMAIACDPSLLIADEPTTALDVTVQAQIFDLLNEIQQSRGMGMILITHDMGVISEMTDRVAVMYGGRVVETGLTTDVLNAPLHPYTVGLMACMPSLDSALAADADLPEIEGVVRSVWDQLPGCPFADRCPKAQDQCFDQMPATQSVNGNHTVACWYPEGGAT